MTSLIRGAMVADGVGNPLIRADVAVKAASTSPRVGDVTESARETVDADGLVLAPGIVDVHTHYDAQVTWESQVTPSPSLGVTTVVMGNCGFSIAPCPPDRREQMARNLAEVEGMPVATLEAGIDWGFESFPEYLAATAAQGVLSQRRGLRRPFGGAHHRARCRGLGARGDRGRDRHHARDREGGGGSGRHRLRHLDLDQPLRRRRRADAVPPRGRRRDARPGRCARRARPRRLPTDRRPQHDEWNGWRASPPRLAGPCS